jgi:hypothetical protein
VVDAPHWPKLDSAATSISRPGAAQGKTAGRSPSGGSMGLLDINTTIIALSPVAVNAIKIQNSC